MRGLGAFLRQPNRRYRNFQIAFTLFTLNFAIPGASYVVRPEMMSDSFTKIGQTLGGEPYTVPEARSLVWRYLGASNVLTLAFLCFLLQLDLRRFHPVLGPLVFLKATTASLFLFEFLLGSAYPAFLAVALFDFATCGLFLYFAPRAAREIRDRPDLELVPVPWSSRGTVRAT